MVDKMKIKRRTFLKTGTIIGSSLMIGFHLPSCSGGDHNIPTKIKGNHDGFAPNAWIKIQKDNTIIIMVSHSEMGQGIATTISMIVAEELEADWSKIQFEMAPVADIYKHPKYGIQWTVSSMSVHASWDRWRIAGASARHLLINAAAQLWGANSADCIAEKSMVRHQPTGRTISYGELTDKTEDIKIPENITLKKPHEFKIIGNSTLRLDSKVKVDGSAIFGIDVKLPNLLVAVVVHPPVFGSTVESYDSGKTKLMPGIHRVLAIETGVAIVADTFWQARKAMPTLEVKWQIPPSNRIDSELLFKRWKMLGQKKDGKIFHEKGDIKKEFNKTTKLVEATYDLPYQAHATPEPMNCTAHVKDTSCEIWVPTQNPEGAQEVAARITGLDYEQITVHSTFIGGGFGRRALVDYVEEAVEISQKTKSPIKLIWPREEDIRHDRYRAANHHVMKAAIDEKGTPLAWFHKIVGSDVFTYATPKIISGIMPNFLPRFIKNFGSYLMETVGPRFIAGKKGIKGAGPLPYDITNIQVQFLNDDPGVPQCWWRSVAPSTNCFAVECFIDELAHAGDRDPYELRMDLLRNNPRLLKVVKTAAQNANWYEPLPNGLFRGIAAHDFQSTMMAFVVEVSVNPSKKIKVHRVVCAVDCGIPINPKNIEAQVQGAMVFGLTATIKSSITFKYGKPQQSNFDDFPLLRMDEMPKVETYIIPSNNHPTGIGEVGVPIIAPAVANAVFAATGKRLRKLPLVLKET